MQSIKYYLLCLILIGIANCVSAQEVYTIKADSTKLTGCDSNELIIENHTQAIKGFLYNTRNGRTIFKKGMEKLNDSTYVFGADTFRYTAYRAWLQGGNSWGMTGILGTLDNNHLTLISNNTERMRLLNNGRLLLGTTTDNTYNQLQVNGSIYGTYFTNFTPNPPLQSGALRLRWGSGDGIYLGFYYQGNTNRRGFIGTASDGRPLLMEDSIGVSFRNSPYVAVGNENGWFTNAKLRVVRPYTQTGDVIAAGRTFSDTSSSLDFKLATTGNVIIGGGTDNSYKLQVYKNGSVNIDGNLSRSTDQIRIGSMFNSGDGQNCIIGTNKAGGGYWPIISERDGNIGIGSNGAQAWVVQSPPLRISSGGTVSIESQYFVFGSTGGPYNSSALVTQVSNPNEWREGLGTYPNGQNTYYFGTRLGNPEGSNHRAPLQIGGYQLAFMPGSTDVEAGRFSEAGYFGLGTTSPSTQLHTTGGVRFAGLTNDNTQTRVVVSDANGNLFYRTLSTWTSNDIPRSSLAVDGEIRAKSLRLKPEGWADYVFDSAYHLPALDDVRNFIRDHKHLPDVPSAAEIAKDGVDVGSNQATLLRKIEELTLYTLDQDKKIEDLQRQVTELQNLKKEIESLKKMILTTTSK